MPFLFSFFTFLFLIAAFRSVPTWFHNFYERTHRELENEKNAAVWEEKNEALRRLGLRTIPNPEESEE